MTTIRCEIVSAEAEIFHGDAAMVIAPGDQGDLGIAPRHAPLITRLRAGTVEVQREDGTRESFFVTGGILEVQPQVVSVLADTAERTEELDESAAREAKQAAEKALANRTDAVDVAEAQARLAEAMAQLQALERMRRNLKH